MFLMPPGLKGPKRVRPGLCQGTGTICIEERSALNRRDCMTTYFDYARTQRLLAVCSMLMLCASASMTAQRRSTCPPSPMGIQFADVAGEGKVAAIAINQNGVVVRRSGGRGGFRRDETWVQQPYFGTDTSGHQNIYFADVDGDGKADAIVSNTTEVAVRLSDGT